MVLSDDESNNSLSIGGVFDDSISNFFRLSESDTNDVDNMIQQQNDITKSFTKMVLKLAKRLDEKEGELRALRKELDSSEAPTEDETTCSDPTDRRLARSNATSEQSRCRNVVNAMSLKQQQIMSKFEVMIADMKEEVAEKERAHKTLQQELSSLSKGDELEAMNRSGHSTYSTDSNFSHHSGQSGLSGRKTRRGRRRMERRHTYDDDDFAEFGGEDLGLSQSSRLSYRSNRSSYSQSSRRSRANSSDNPLMVDVTALKKEGKRIDLSGDTSLRLMI